MRLFKILLFALIGIMAFFSIFMIIDFFFGRRDFRSEDELNICKDGVMYNYNDLDFIKLSNRFASKNYQDCSHIH